MVTLDRIKTVMNAEHKKKISDALKGRTPEEAVASRKKAVIQLGPDLKILNSFSSVREAARELNLHASHISNVCKYKRRTTGGYIFRYKEDATLS